MAIEDRGIKSLWGYPLIDSKGRHAIDDVRSNLENNFQKKTDDTLGTTDKTVPGAINEIKNNIDTIGDNFTSEKTETKYDMKYNGKSIGSINIELEEDQIAGGDGSFNIDLTPYQTKNDDTLTTTNKTIIGGINEIKNDIIGNKDTLTTTNKTNIVGSINEVNAQCKDIANDVKKPISLDKCDEEMLGAIQNKQGQTTFELLSIPRDNSVNYNKLDSKIQNVFKETYEVLTLTWHTGGFYSYLTGNMREDSDTTYCYADVINVVVGEKFIISGRSRWEAALYIITDSAGKILLAFPNKNQTGTSYSNITFEIPSNGTRLLINKTQNVETTLKKVNGYSVKETINKKWVAFGDSLTDSVTLGNEPNYTNYIADNLGLSCINCGKGGTGYINNNGGTQQFYNRTSSIPADTDILTVFGSFNDLYMEDIPVGTITDTGTDTLYGAINTFLKNCWDINPSMIIGIISPTPWHNWYRGHSDNSRVEKCVNYVQVLKTIAEYYSLPFLDLFSCSNLRPWEQAIKDLYYLNKDGIHPNSLGHKKYVTPKIESFIKSMIQ